jgi:hypothetical protein
LYLLRRALSNVRFIETYPNIWLKKKKKRCLGMEFNPRNQQPTFETFFFFVSNVKHTMFAVSKCMHVETCAVSMYMYLQM